MTTLHQLGGTAKRVGSCSSPAQPSHPNMVSSGFHLVLFLIKIFPNFVVFITIIFDYMRKKKKTISLIVPPWLTFQVFRLWCMSRSTIDTCTILNILNNSNIPKRWAWPPLANTGLFMFS